MGEILTPIAFQIELLRLTEGTLAANKRRGHPADIAKGRKAAERAEKALDAHNAALRAEVERLKNDRDFYRENSAALGHALEIGNAKIEGLRALLLEVAEGGVEFDDPRVRYVAVQIDADTWARVKALTAPAEEGK